MGHRAAGALDNDKNASQPPGREPGALDTVPQPEFSAPIPGPQPGFSHNSDFNLHQIHYDDLYAPGPVPANYDHDHDPMKPRPASSVPIPGPQPLPEEYTQHDDHPQGYDAPHPLKSQPTFSAPIPGPQPGFFQEPQSDVHYQPAHPAQQTNYDAPYAPRPVGPPVGPIDTSPINPLQISTGQQPMQSQQVQIPSYNVPWTTGLFDCCDDPTSAIITFCVPCVTFGQAAEIIDEGSTTCATHAMFYSCVWFLIGCPCILSFSYRTKLRAKYNLMESPANDFLTHFICEHCALCQMHRELSNRGIDPSIGWQANAQRMQQQQQTDHMAPPPRQAMM